MKAKKEHPFILSPGSWLGEGYITFPNSDEKIKFYTKWHISHPSINSAGDAGIECSQQVQMQGTQSQLTNHLYFSLDTLQAFHVELNNEMLGILNGKGIIDEKLIAWEFRNSPNMEGYEVYNLQENGEYQFHSEYSSTEFYRTIIDGRLWKKTEGISTERL